jgi:hypothetical protein
LSRNLALIALATLMQGCQQPEPEPRTQPSLAIEQGRAAGPEGDRETAELRLSHWGVGMPSSDGPVGGAAARIDGVLSQVGGCLVVDSDGGVRVHPVFPAGKARWNPATGTLSFAGRVYRPGDRITLGGGGVASPSAYRREAGVEIAPCEIRDLWVAIS